MAALRAGAAVASGHELEWIGLELLGLALEQRPDCRWPLWVRLLVGKSVGPARLAAGALVEQWDRWPEEVRRSAVRSARERLIDAAMEPPDSARGLRARAVLAAETRAAGLLPVVARALHAGGDAADAAEAATVLIAAHDAGVDDAEVSVAAAIEAEDGGAGASGSVSEAVAAMVATYGEHRRDGVLLAAAVQLTPARLSYGGRGDPLARWFADREDAAHVAMRGVLRRSDLPVWRRRAWEWLGRDEAAAAALDRVAFARTPEEHAPVLERTHLLANPARARRVGLITAKVKGRLSVLPPAGMAPQLSDEARRGLPVLAAVLRPRAGVLERALAPLLGDPDAKVRFALARVAEGSLLSDLCFDTDAHVAGPAALRMLAGGLELPGPLARSPHPWVRRLAREEAARRDLWGGGEWSRLAAHRALRLDRGAFLAELRRRIAEGEVATRVQAIMLARHLELPAEIELELLSAASGDADEQVAATAAAALGDAGTASARQALVALLDHGSARVRANAAEGIARMQRRANAGHGVPPELADLGRDEHHRVRSTALVGLLAAGGDERPAALDRLCAMLGDDRPLHRLAGLWALERSLLGAAGASLPRARWDELASRIATLARTEPEAAVRKRAVRCAGRMLARMRHGWAARAAGLEVAA